MLIFTIDSVRPIFTLLENKISIENNAIFFNDGNQLRKVVGYKTIEQYFDVNGMSETHIVGYEMNLVDGVNLRLQIKGDSIEVSPLELVANATKVLA